MAWIIMKSAGDNYSFVAMHVGAEIGHPREYAQKLAREVTEAMKAYKHPEVESVERTGGCPGCGQTHGHLWNCPIE